MAAFGVRLCPPLAFLLCCRRLYVVLSAEERSVEGMRRRGLLLTRPWFVPASCCWQPKALQTSTSPAASGPAWTCSRSGGKRFCEECLDACRPCPLWSA